MKIYTIANESQETYGHGDFGTEQRIIRQGAYGAGRFPPCFKTIEEATDWIGKQQSMYDKSVVELELID